MVDTAVTLYAPSLVEVATRQLREPGRRVLPRRDAGELPDEALASEAREVASTLLLGFAERKVLDYLGS